MRPLLALHADGQEHAAPSLRSALADHFDLSQPEREERIPSGRARRFDNRVGWATTYLAQTALLERPGRGVTRITARGHEMLESEPTRIDLTVLSRFPELDAFRARGSHVDSAGGPNAMEAVAAAANGEGTPEEAIVAAYDQIRSAVAEDLRNRIGLRGPAFFEQLVLDVLHAMGYGDRRRDATERLGRTGDEGLDGVIREDKLGLDVIYVHGGSSAIRRGRES